MFMSMSLCFCVIKPGFVRSRSIYIYIYMFVVLEFMYLSASLREEM